MSHRNLVPKNTEDVKVRKNAQPFDEWQSRIIDLRYLNIYPINLPALVLVSNGSNNILKNNLVFEVDLGVYLEI